MPSWGFGGGTAPGPIPCSSSAALYFIHGITKGHRPTTEARRSPVEGPRRLATTGVEVTRPSTDTEGDVRLPLVPGPFFFLLFTPIALSVAKSVLSVFSSS